MFTNDPGTTNPDPAQQAGHDTEPAPSAGPSREAGIEATPTGAKDVRQTGPDTGQRASTFTTKLFRTAGLDQGRRILREEVTHLINLPTAHLWDAYSLDDRVLEEVRTRLIEEHYLTKVGAWNRTKVKKESFLARGTGHTEVKTFAFFARLFNLVLGGLKQAGHGTVVKKMVHAGSVGPKSTRVGTHRPDAFLHMTTSTSTAGKFRWRDLTCPFEYKFGNGNAVDVSQPGPAARQDHILILPQNDTKALWSLLHIMRCDPRRMFSFGSTIYGTKFRIWLLCRAAPFTFTPFDWFEVGAAFVLHVSARLTSPRTLTHSSSSSSCSLPPLRLTLASTRTSRVLARQISTFSLTFKGRNITLQGYSTILALMQRLAGGHGHSRWWTKRRSRYASSRIAGSRIVLGNQWNTTS